MPLTPDAVPPLPPPNPYMTAECSACGSLLRECVCYGSRSPRFTDYSAPVTFQGDPSPRFPRYVGVEIECGTPRHMDLSLAPVHHMMRATHAQLHSDMSIHGFGHGLEVVTAPSRGVKAEENIRAACQALQAVNASVNESCGLHVHVDARDYTEADMVRFATLYSRIEKTLYSVVSRSRRGGGRSSNDFGQPWGPSLVAGGVDDSSLTLSERYAAFQVNTYGSVQEAEHYKRSKTKHGSRYHGVSFNAYDIRGTLEFRLHHGTVNARKATMWSAVCSALVQWVKDHTDAELDALRGTPAEILEKILTDREVARWVRIRRRFFEDKDRARRGLPPRRAARPAVAPEPALPAEEAPESAEEIGEVRNAGVRPGRRMSY